MKIVCLIRGRVISSRYTTKQQDLTDWLESLRANGYETVKSTCGWVAASGYVTWYVIER